MKTPSRSKHLLSSALLYAACLAAVSAFNARAGTVWLDSLDLTQIRQDWGSAQTNRSIRGTPLTINGVKFERGIGTHASSTFWLKLDGSAQRLSAKVGVDDAAGGNPSIVFKVVANNRTLFDSGVLKLKSPAKTVDLDLTGLKTVLLQVTDGGDGIEYDHADWAEAKIDFTGAAPVALAAPAEPAIILTPTPGPAPRINGPTIYGARPGNPFLYRIPAQGDRPMTFSAKNLPKSLKLDASTGIITGQTPPVGVYRVTLKASNSHGKSTRLFRIVAGQTLSLTPSMGWNHWYAHYDRITDPMVREAADVLVSSGMADVGYQYVNIDDCWMNAPKQSDPLRVGPLRDDAGNLLPNRHFPDMRALTDYIHSKGLKAGLYTSPGPFTCAGFTGAFQHEAQDARQFADWGFDFLKYDWCSYGDIVRGDNPAATNLPANARGPGSPRMFQYPYELMGKLLQEQKRDILFNLCQYGMGNVWEWGAAVGGQSWRTAGDLGFELNRIFEVALKNAEHRAWSRPGSWNDPDYLQIGWVGDARGGGMPKPSSLTPNEQYAYMSLWALMASPLFYSGDMPHLDEFTLNVLCNPEVIDVNQDALGQSAAVSMLNNAAFIMVKDLEDGSKAIGLFNRGEFPEEVVAPWPVLGLSGKQLMRDLWRQQDLGCLDVQFTTTLPRHGAVLLRATKAGQRR